MGWKTIIIGSECNVSLSLGRLRISVNNEYHNVPLVDLDTVIFSHNKVVITIPLLSELVKNNINVVICDSKNDPIGVFNSFNNHSLVFKQLKNQINWKGIRKKKLWKVIIENKIQSEIDILQSLNKKQNLNLLKQYKKSVYTDDQTNREAICARIYFSDLFGDSFKRDNDDNMNFALNYGYKIIASYINKCIVSRGLLPQLGIHHIGESNPFNLTYDFIEPIRAIVDHWVYTNVNDHFSTYHKQELVSLLEYKVYCNSKWLRLSDAIEDIIDSYISFLNEKTEIVLTIDISKGYKNE